MTPCGIKNPHTDTKEFKEFGALWDTGAMGTVVTPRLVKSLGLPPMGSTLMRGVLGKQIVNNYDVELRLPNNVVIEGLKVSEANFASEIDVLIGMDIISMGDFSVCQGQFVSYCVPSFDDPIDFVEKAKKVNKKIDKQNQRFRQKK